MNNQSITSLYYRRGQVWAEVKYFEPASANGTRPDRYRYVQGWLKTDALDAEYFQEPVREGWFKFVDGFCPRYLGEHPAIILKRFPESEIESIDLYAADRFEEYTK